MSKVIMEERIEPDEGILHHAECVDLMQANIELSAMEVSLVNSMSREIVLRTIWKRFKDKYLKYNYDNLVYTCPFCNRAKSDKWVGKDETEAVVGNRGFIDPCSPDYSKNLGRNDKGSIVPLTDLGEYIYRELKLYLERHRICFMIDLIDEKRRLLKIKREKLRTEGQSTEAIDKIYYKINETLITYYQMMFDENG